MSPSTIRNVMFEYDCRNPRIDLIPFMTPTGVDPDALTNAIIAAHNAGIGVVSCGEYVRKGKAALWFAETNHNGQPVGVANYPGLVQALEALVGALSFQ